MTRLDDADSQSIEAKILRAEVNSLEAEQLADQGKQTESLEKYNVAEKLLNDALKASPQSPEVRSARAMLELKLPFPEHRTAADRIRAAEKILEQAHQEIGDHLTLRLAAARVARLLPVADSLSVLSDLEKPALSPDEQAELLEGLGQAYDFLASRTSDAEQKQTAQDRAMAAFKQAAELQPQNIARQIALVEFAIRLEVPAAIDAAIARVEKLEGPNGPNGNYLKAQKLLAKVEEPGSVFRKCQTQRERPASSESSP